MNKGNPGRMVITPAAASILINAGLNPLDFIQKYQLDGQEIFSVGRTFVQVRLEEGEMGYFFAFRAASTLATPLGTKLQLPGGSQIVVTEGAAAALWGSLDQPRGNPLELLRRHLDGDWGDLGVEDRRANDRDVAAGEGAISSYDQPDGRRIYVSTEYTRQVTTILLPEEN